MIVKKTIGPKSFVELINYLHSSDNYVNRDHPSGGITMMVFLKAVNPVCLASNGRVQGADEVVAGMEYQVTLEMVESCRKNDKPVFLSPNDFQPLFSLLKSPVQERSKV